MTEDGWATGGELANRTRTKDRMCSQDAGGRSKVSVELCWAVFCGAWSRPYVSEFLQQLKTICNFTWKQQRQGTLCFKAICRKCIKKKKKNRVLWHKLRRTGALRMSLFCKSFRVYNINIMSGHCRRLSTGSWRYCVIILPTVPVNAESCFPAAILSNTGFCIAGSAACKHHSSSIKATRHQQLRSPEERAAKM